MIEFIIDCLGKIGPPIFAATLVGCLLAGEVKNVHWILMTTGVFFIGLEQWYQKRK